MKHFVLLIVFIEVPKFTSSFTVSISIPKCGSHLTTLLLKRILNADMEQIRNDFSEDYYFGVKPFSEDLIYWGHCWPTTKAINFFGQKNVKAFFVFRDPRDQILSYIDWVYKKRFTPVWI